MIFTPFQLFKRKIVFSILLTGMVFACNAPEDLIEEKNPSNAKVTILRKAEIENKKMLFTKISKMKQNFVNSKTVTSSAYQFSIDTNMCKMVEVNGITTYTFAVTREQPNGFFENLVIKENNDGSYSAYLLQYNISEAEKQQLLNGVDIDLNNRINKIAITDTDFISDITSKVYYNPNACYDVSIVTVPSRSCPEDHTSPDVCKYADPNSPLYDPSLMPIIGYSTLVYTEIDCPTSGGGGGGTGTSDPALGGGTSPTVSGDLPEFGDSPCEKLKNLTNSKKANLKGVINGLKLEVDNNGQDKECGEELLKFQNGLYSSNTITCNIGNTINMAGGGDIYGSIHTHPFCCTYPIFSWSDLFSLYELTINSAPHNLNDIVVLLVCKDDNNVFQVYALMFNNETNNTIQNFINSPQFNGCSNLDIRSEMDEILTQKFLEHDKSDKDFEKAFLRQVFGYNVSLYKASQDLNSWTRLKLNNNSKNSTKTTQPCN